MTVIGVIVVLQSKDVTARIDHFRAAKSVAVILDQLEAKLDFRSSSEEGTWLIDGATVHFTNSSFAIKVRRKDAHVGWIVNLPVDDNGGTTLSETQLRRRADEWRRMFMPSVKEWRTTKSNLNLKGPDFDGKHRWYSERAEPTAESVPGLKSVGVSLEVSTGLFRVINIEREDDRQLSSKALAEVIRTLRPLPAGWRRRGAYELLRRRVAC